MKLVILLAALHGAAACTSSTQLGCTYTTWFLSCPSGQELQSYGSCGLWGAGKERQCYGCCNGFAGANCDQPVCSSGCGHGTCTAPETCTCNEGFTGTTCDMPSMVTSPHLMSIQPLVALSINFACRDVAQLSGCDNCQTRFDLMARAIRGEAGFSGVANFSAVDVVIAQELGTDQSNFAQITSALASRGFTHTTGAPSPTTNDPQCRNPPGPLFSLSSKRAFSALSGLRSGGLVTFSKHPILHSASHNWCAHNLPAPAGYLSTLVDVRGTSALVVNMHLFPEYDFGVEAADVRTYQFSEIAAYANAAEAALRHAGTPFAIVLGGDFNEDAYGKSSTAAGRDCARLSAAAATKLAALNLDVNAACASGAVGTPTWSPSTNDLAERFTDGSQHEVLDYIVLHSSSHAAASMAVPNAVATLRATDKWSGTFCESSVLGTVGATYSGDASALTDHNTVTAMVPLPAPPADKAAAAAAATAAFQSMLPAWTSDAGAQEAACGQTGAQCAFDTNCCEAPFSWTAIEQRCDRTSFTCKACVPLGGACGSTLLQIEGSPCCGYDDYSSGNGAHCELTISGGPVCIRKFDAGHSCLYDEECQSKDCKMEFRFGWSWWPIGKYCQ